MMHDVLHPLTLQPGIRQAAVISSDGVPVCVLERPTSGAGEFVDCTTSSQPDLEGQRIDPASLAALAASWVDDLVRSGGQFAWEVPKRFVLVASQATLMVEQGPNAHVMVVLEPSVAPEAMELPLHTAVERLHRLLTDLGRFDADQSAPALPSGANAPSGAALQAPSAADYASGASAPLDVPQSGTPDGRAAATGQLRTGHSGGSTLDFTAEN